MSGPGVYFCCVCPGLGQHCSLALKRASKSTEVCFIVVTLSHVKSHDGVSDSGDVDGQIAQIARLDGVRLRLRLSTSGAGVAERRTSGRSLIRALMVVHPLPAFPFEVTRLCTVVAVSVVFLEA